MELWGSSVIFVLLFSSNTVLSTAAGLTSSPISNATAANESSKSLNKSTTLVTDTKENEVQKPPLNVTANQASLDKQNKTKIGQDVKKANISSLFPSNHSTDEDLKDLQPTNASNFKYTVDSSDTKSHIDTEVQDLENVPKPSVDHDVAPNEPKIKYKPNDPVDTQIFLKDDSINVNFEGKRLAEKDNGIKPDNLEHVALVPGKLAAILAGVFLAISIIGYVSLLSWRRYLENRYGNREMLVDDEYCEKQMNDLEHFSVHAKTFEKDYI